MNYDLQGKQQLMEHFRTLQWLIIMLMLHHTRRTSSDDRRGEISFKTLVYKWFISFGIHLIGVIDLKDSDSVWHISLNVK